MLPMNLFEHGQRMMSANAVAIAEPDRIDSLNVPLLRSRCPSADMVSVRYDGLVQLGEPVPDDVICEGMVGRSVVLRHAVTQLETVAPTDATVLICGETGTGKELIARALHTLSTRRGHAFVKCNCAAIPTGLLESELFGHEKGAFTGAVAQRIGRFELAHRGRSFSTKSARRRSNCSPSCSGSCRSANSSGSATRARCAPARDSWPRRT